MSNTLNPKTTDGLPEADSIDREYRSVHPIAVLTIVSSIFVPLALLTEVLWIAPVITVVFGVFALRFLANAPEKIGRKGVLVALALAVFFGSWAPARYFSRQQWLYQKARGYADAWLELVQQQKLYKAHQLHLHWSQRVAEGVSLDDFYSKLPYTDNEFYTFFETTALKAITGLKEHDGTIEFYRAFGYERYSSRDIVELQYLVEFEHENRREKITIYIMMARQLDVASGDRQWRVDRVDTDDLESGVDLRTSAGLGQSPT